ncbi:MAG: depupylase/deamidase Dop [Nitrospiraceae bacterium]
MTSDPRTHAATPVSRTLGTETEYGIATKDQDLDDSVANSIRVIGAYPDLLAPHAVWDYEQENPLVDARGFEVEGERERPDPEYNRRVNKLLANGGRWYVDGAHPEYSTPECLSPLDIVVYERAGDRVAAACLAALDQWRGGNPFILYRNNSDGKGNSYGYHENYLVSRAVPFDRLAKALIPFLVTRSIVAGAGKVGAENHTAPCEFQISQRADFFETLLDLNTMVRRPIMNTRDEPHADAAQYRRLHVIVGDANMAELSTYLKVGTLALVLDAVEAGWPLPVFELENPVRAIKEVSRDLEVKHTLKLADGRPTTALHIQRAYADAIGKFVATAARPPFALDVQRRWTEVLDQLDSNPMALARKLDWVAKRQLIESYMDRKGLGWDDPRAKLLDLQYHDIRPEKGLYYTLERAGHMDRLCTEARIAAAVDQPPDETRAYFRGRCVAKFPRAIYGASWTSLLVMSGSGAIKRVPLMDPYRGTKTLTGSLLDRSASVDELLANLQGAH